MMTRERLELEKVGDVSEAVMNELKILHDCNCNLKKQIEVYECIDGRKNLILICITDTKHETVPVRFL